MPHVTPLHANDPGRVGRYRLTGRIVGMSAPGRVYLGRTVDGSEVTITLLEDGRTAVAVGADRDRFTAEANAASRVAPFCAARILGAGFDGGHAFLVSEYVAGPSLAEFVIEEGPWEDGDLEALAIGTATGLAAIHQAGLVHGNFGPRHVVLGPYGPRVVEFGITPPYGSATPAADMRAWASTVLFAAVGEPAHPEDLRLLPEPLQALARRCACADPAEQPSARSVLAELLGEPDPPAGVLGEGARRAARAAVRVPARDTVPDLPPGSPRRRAATIWWVAGVAACIVAIAVAISFAQSQTGQPTEAAKPAAPIPQPTAARQSGRERAPARSAAVPADLAGSWSGQVRQTSPAAVFNVRLLLASGTRGGTVQYTGASFSCSGKLRLVSDVHGTLTMDQAIVQGKATCADGMVTLSRVPGSAAAFSFSGGSGPTAAGLLTRQ